MIEFNVGVNSLQRRATKCQENSEENQPCKYEKPQYKLLVIRPTANSSNAMRTVS